jgi:adenine-specific DNA methylase
MEKMLIFVDDERDCPKEFKKYFPLIKICRNYKEAIYTLEHENGVRDLYISLDHDLGSKKSGYDIAKYIVEKGISIDGFKCHSMNIVGKENIENLLLHYGYKNQFDF